CGVSHVRVSHRQLLNTKAPLTYVKGAFLCLNERERKKNRRLRREIKSAYQIRKYKICPAHRSLYVMMNENGGILCAV
ncbi:hypothetical protein ABLT94_09270, partial [Acinetobacter soli]|uniref:hypothetical protein n=1 Tax=Acinetobacter soli TaxID=487316 RepID=UPI0032B47BBA